MSTSQWAGQELPAMWASAQAADTLMAWQQVNAWQRTFDLLLHHERQLRACRHELIAAWPPERSPAAQSFVEYLDSLLISIGNAQEDALANRRGLFGVLSSLASTKSDMAKMKAKWDEYEAEEQALSKNLSNVLPSSATHDWRRALSELARERMTRNDQEVLEASRQMTPSQPVELRSGGPGDPDDNSSGGRSSGSAGVAGGTHVGMTDWMQAPVVPSLPDPDKGVGLAGGVAGTSSPSLGGARDPSQPSLHGGGLPSRVPTVLPSIGSPLVSNAPVPSRSIPIATNVGPKYGAGVGHGGVIGGHTSGGAHQVGNNVVGTPVRRVNPVGGVVGGTLNTTGLTAIPLTAARGRRATRGFRPERDPYNVWAVDEGVPPVIEQPPNRPHSTGPGVIGIDR